MSNFFDGDGTILEVAIMGTQPFLLGSLKEEKLSWVRNSGCNEFSHLSQPDEFTSQSASLIYDIFISTVLLYRFASYEFIPEKERGQKKVNVKAMTKVFSIFIEFNLS